MTPVTFMRPGTRRSYAHRHGPAPKDSWRLHGHIEDGRRLAARRRTPSSTRAIPSSKYASPPAAVLGRARPFGFALGAVTGPPSASTRPRAIGCDETRSPSVPLLAVTSGGTWA